MKIILLKIKVFLLFCLYTHFSLAVEHYFDLGEITARGELSQYPAGLGWLEAGLSFSASASVLEKKSFDFNFSSYEPDSQPISIKPSFIASGLGKSWGGWSLLIQNQSDEIKSQTHLIEAGQNQLEQNQSKLEFKSRTNLLSASLNAGQRIADNWSIGWNATLAQEEIYSMTNTVFSSQNEKSLSLNQIRNKAVLLNIGFGFLFSSDHLTVGYHLVSPNLVIDNTGLNQNQKLSTLNNEISDTVIENKLKIERNTWGAECGVRFGSKGFVYLISDKYSFIGSHELRFGFEYVGSWGTIATGISESSYALEKKNKILVGFAKKNKNFKWAVGPYLETEKNDNLSGIGSSSYGVLFASEIKY